MNVFAGSVLNPQFVDAWAWAVGLELFLLSLAGGSLVLFNLHALRHWPARARSSDLPVWVDLLAPVCILCGVGLLVFDLGPRLPATWFSFVLEPSIMTWGSWLVALGFIVGVARVCQRPEIRQWRLISGVAGTLDGLGRGLAGMSIVIGAGIGLYTGALLANLAARPLWASQLLPLFFLGYGLACAAAVMVLTRPSPQAEVVRGTEVVYVAIALALGVAYVLSTPAARTAMSAGWPGLVFWGIGLGIGLVVPLGLALGACAWTRLRPLADRTAPWLILVGALAIRQALLYAAKGA